MLADGTMDEGGRGEGWQEMMDGEKRDKWIKKGKNRGRIGNGGLLDGGRMNERGGAMKSLRKRCEIRKPAQGRKGREL